MAKLSSALLSTALLPLLGACDPPGATEDDGAGEVTYRCAFCCKTCGLGNSSMVNGFIEPSVRLTGTPAHSEVHVLGVHPPNSATLYTLDLVDEEFIARASPGGAILAAGADMVGWSIVMGKQDYANLAGPDEILLDGYDNNVPAWSDFGGVHTAYSLTYKKAGLFGFRRGVTICGGPIGTVNATLISGETYDEDTATVYPNRPDWFTIACAGTAVGKMKMFGFGPSDSVDGQGPATWQERQATLKMISADYCGDGTSHTEAGTLVAWANSHGTIEPDDPDPSVLHEALWTENGAICLDEPRLWDREDVACADALPTCDQIAGEGWVWDTASLGGN